MKRKSAFFAILIFCLLWGTPCSAEEYADMTPSEIYTALNADDSAIYSALPSEAEEILSENGVSIDDAGRFSEISPSEVIGYIFEKFKDRLKYPMKTLGLMIGAAVLSAAVSSFSETVPGSGTGGVYEILAVMTAAAAVSSPAAECIDRAAATIKAGGTFMLAYVPVYAGIAASSGTVTAAAAYNMTVIAAAEGAVQLSANIILPLMSACMALGISDSIGTKLSLGTLTALINKICTFSFLTVMTVFTGMLSLQSALGTAADSIGMKAAKLAVSNFIPVVGGALSDTYGAVRSGLTLLKSAAGIYGIAAAALILLPPVIEAAALYLSVSIGAAIAEILGQGRLVKLFKNTASVIGMVLGMLLCFGAMLIISTGILMVQKN